MTSNSPAEDGLGDLDGTVGRLNYFISDGLAIPSKTSILVGPSNPGSASGCLSLAQGSCLKSRVLWTVIVVRMDGPH